MNIRLYHPNSIQENTSSLLSKEHTHYVVNVMRLKKGSYLNFFNIGKIIILNTQRKINNFKLSHFLFHK